MTWWAGLKVILQYGPELIDLLKSIVEMSKNGITNLQVKARIKGVSNAFEEKDLATSARMLNDIFRK